MSNNSLSQYNASVVVTSDSCFEDSSLDTSGHIVVESLRSLNFVKVSKFIVQDDYDAIRETIKSTLDDPQNTLTITVGGTGLTPRDVTPEATSSLYEKSCNGISTALMMASLRYNCMAALSRLTAGITKSCLIINFPGGSKACRQCSDVIAGFIEHAIEQIRDNRYAQMLTHQQLKLDERRLTNSVHIDSSGIPKVSSNKVLPITAELDTSVGISSSPPVGNLHKGHETISSSVADIKLKDLDTSAISRFSTEALSENQKISKTFRRPVDACRVKPSVTSSPYKLISFEKALSILGSLSRNFNHSILELSIDTLDAAEKAVGYTLAVDVVSKSIVPPFPVSTVDGYVLHVPSHLRKMPVKTATAFLVNNYNEFEQSRKTSGAVQFICCQINTGCRIPEGDVVIVPFEQTEVLKPGRDRIKITKYEPNRYIRLPGSDLTKEDKVEAGTRLDPVTLPLIQSMGYSKIQVLRQPVIGLLSTGDELVEDYDCESTTAVLDTNRPMLGTLFKTKGYGLIDCGICKDDPEKILFGIKYGLSNADILVVTGGASMGTRDHVKDVIVGMGGHIHFGRVNIKPGKPVAFASIDVDGRSKFIFSLPGNPVSAYITSLVLVIPFVEHSLANHFPGAGPISLKDIGDLVEVKVTKLLDDSEKEGSYIFDGRMEFVRARLILDEKNGSCTSNAEVSVKQQSSRMLNLKDCNCLIIVDPSLKDSKFLAGQTYPALKMRN